MSEIKGGRQSRWRRKGLFSTQRISYRVVLRGTLGKTLLPAVVSSPGQQTPLSRNVLEHAAVHLFLPRAPGMLIAFPFQACLVHTSETIRVCYFMERLLERRRPVMLVGTAGTGKSVLVGAQLASLAPENYLVKNVPFNYYTTSAMLQGKGPRRHVGGGGCVRMAVWPVTELGQSQVPAQMDGASPLTVPFSPLPSLLFHNPSVPLLQQP